MKEKKNYSFCLDVWYGYEDGVNCGFAHDGQGHKIFDSQVQLAAKLQWLWFSAIIVSGHLLSL